VFLQGFKGPGLLETSNQTWVVVIRRKTK